MIDRLDDLRAAASLPGISGGDFINYAERQLQAAASRLSRPAGVPRPPETPTTDPDGMESGPKDDTIDGWRDFLDTYPDSPKAEAASFRMTRLIAGNSATAAGFHGIPFSRRADRQWLQTRIGACRMDPATDPEAVIAAIRDHEARFPAGRYRDDLNLLRAGALDRLREIPAGARIVRDRSWPIPSSATCMWWPCSNPRTSPSGCWIPSSARQPPRRSAARPGAIARLRLLVDGDTFLSRLKPMMPWLEEG